MKKIILIITMALLLTNNAQTVLPFDFKERDLIKIKNGNIVSGYKKYKPENDINILLKDGSDIKHTHLNILLIKESLNKDGLYISKLKVYDNKQFYIAYWHATDAVATLVFYKAFVILEKEPDDEDILLYKKQKLDKRKKDIIKNLNLKHIKKK